MTDPDGNHPGRAEAGHEAGRARGWRLLRRLLLAVVLGLALAIGLLPVVTSGAWLAGLVSDRISGVIKMPVRIGHAEWGWWKGVVVKDVQLGDGQPDGVQLRQLAIRANIWNLLIDKTIPQIRLSEVTVDLGRQQTTRHSERPKGVNHGREGRPATTGTVAVSGEDGTSEQQSLVAPATQSGSVAKGSVTPDGVAKIEALPVAVNQIVLDRCHVNLRDPASGAVVSISLPNTTIDLDRRTGVLMWQLSARAGQAGRVRSEGQFVLPRLALGPADLRGSLHLTWDALALEMLPTSVLSRLGLTGLAGKANGSLSVQMSQDWTLKYSLTAGVRGLTVQSAGQVHRLSQATGGMTGQWQMIEQHVNVRKAWAQVPGAQLTAGEPALIYDGQNNHVVQSNLTCRVTDAAALREALVQLGVKVPADMEMAGGASIDVHVNREATATVASLAISGEALTGMFGAYFRHQGGEPLALNAMCRLSEDGSIELQNASLDLPGGRIRASAQLAAREGADRQVVLKDSQLRVEWDDFETFASQAPLLQEAVASCMYLSGPGSVRARASAEPQGSRASLALDLGAAAQTAMNGWFDKPAGRDLRLDIATHLSPRYDSLAVDLARVSSAGEPLVQIEGVNLATSRRVDRGRSLLMLELKGVLAGLDLTAIQQLSPKLAEELRPSAVSGRLQGRVQVSCWADAKAASLRLSGVQAAGELGLDDLGISVEGALRKQAGQMLRLAGSLAYRWGEDGRSGRGYGNVGVTAQGFSGQAWYENSPGSPQAQQWAWGWMDVNDIGKAVGMVPAAAAAVKQCNLAGRMTGRWEWTRHRDTFDLNCGFDLTGLQCSREFLRMNKPAGLPERMELSLSGPAAGAQGAKACHWRVPKAEFILGQSYARISDADLEISKPWAQLLAGHGRQAVHAIDFAWPISRASGKVAGTAVFGEVLASVNPELGALLEKYRADGPVPWTADWNYDFAKGIEYTAKADAAQLALHVDALDKPAGVPLEATIKGRAQFYQDAHNRLMVSLNTSQAKGRAASLVWSGQSQAEVCLAGGQASLKRAKVEGKFDSPCLEEVASLLAPARPWQLQGHLASEGTFTFTEQSGWKVQDVDIGCWPVECSAGGARCRVLGLVNLQDHTVQMAGLEAELGRTQAKVTANATLADGSLTGQVGTAFRYVDVEELIHFVQRMQAARASGSARPNGPAQAPMANVQGTGTSSQAVSGGRPQPGAPPARPGIIDWTRSELKFVGSAETLSSPLSAGEPAVTFRGLAWHGAVDGGSLAADVAGAFQGGPLAADVRGSLVDKSAALKIHYRADRMDATDVTRRMVVKGFPGMTVDGPVTLDETLTIDLAHELPAPLSEGELIVEGGIVRGAAAPKWVTRVFPGLQLASFKFSRMHNWYQRDASGRTANRIIFRGSPWSMYMNGWSQLDGKMRYEIGVDLLGPAESEYWATADRGRIPLFNKTGQVIDGQLHNEVVSFLGPQQIGERILKDNLLTIAYHAIRQQVLRGRAAPSDREVLAPERLTE